MMMMSSTNCSLGIENYPIWLSNILSWVFSKKNWGAKRQMGLAKGKWGTERQMWVPKRQRGAKKADGVP
jgi:hypothetical protein